MKLQKNGFFHSIFQLCERGLLLLKNTHSTKNNMFFQVFLASSCECCSGIKRLAPNVKTPILLFTFPIHYMRCLPSSFFVLFLFCSEPIWLTNHSKQMKLWRLLKIEGKFILKHRAPPFGPPIQMKQGQHLPKLGQKWGAIGNYFGNTSRTWELLLWETPPPLPSPQTEKNDSPLSTPNTTLKRNPLSSPPHPQEQKGGPFTAGRDFSLLARKFYS
jgi:hypothetical protein